MPELSLLVSRPSRQSWQAYRYYLNMIDLFWVCFCVEGRQHSQVLLMLCGGVAWICLYMGHRVGLGRLLDCTDMYMSC